jgi:molybdopterin synthase catalytic subunit
MEIKKNKVKNCFITGPISSNFIGNSIAKHQTKKNIGAHQIFLGQVRADQINNKEVKAIDYSAQEEMANKAFHDIREKTFEKFDLICMHIYHSIGLVTAGEICLFVFVSAKQRNNAQAAIEYLIEEIKSKAPIFGKEIFEDQTHQWKINN